MRKSRLQQELADLEYKAETLDKIIEIAKTPGGRLTEDGQNLLRTLRKAGMRKSDVARVLNVTPATLTKYQ
jgi:Mn-dependent DtxR family transcriptional regulator